MSDICKKYKYGVEKEDSYILCNLRFFHSELYQEVEKPLILYADGTLEIKSLPNAQFKDRTGGDCKQWYRHIEECMADLGTPVRDLRHDFHPRREHQLFFEVLERIRERDTISISELWKFWYKEEIEMCIGAAKERAAKLLNRRMRQQKEKQRRSET